MLDGTRHNCAGGTAPLGTWLSCEETVEGLVWEWDLTGRAAAVQCLALGSLTHEAVAVDGPRPGKQTELQQGRTWLITGPFRTSPGAITSRTSHGTGRTEHHPVQS
jgi:hypothetical protein